MAKREPQELDFHFDVMCPFAYQTSLWIREVARQVDLTIHWKFFSLEEVNRQEGKKHPWERDWSYGWSMMRIGAYLRRSSMDDLDRWYGVAGEALHVRGLKPHDPDVARALLAGLDLDPALVDRAIDDPTTNEEVLAVLIDRLKWLNSKFPCDENEQAIWGLEYALMHLNLRTMRRKDRNVEGKNLA